MPERPVLPHPASFRDPSGYIFTQQGSIFRAVSKSYQSEYDLLMSSNLYVHLIEQNVLIPHQEVSTPTVRDAYKVLKPEMVQFISYPYEWSFSQLKDAALTTLEIQTQALNHGMSLKDASAYNIQFHNGTPTLIDTLSFESYKEGQPWVAYRQFCQHFLAPLALMAHVDLRLGTLSAKYIDGVPLDLAVSLLPGKTKFSLGLGTHIHLHARSQHKYADTSLKSTPKGQLHKNQLNGLLLSLRSSISALTLPKQKTEWGNYYDNTNYTDNSRTIKEKTVREWITAQKPKTVWDAGANDGTFSRLASAQGIFTVASDIDPLAVERSYQHNKQSGERLLLPLIIDLTNPSPAIGWRNTERDSFLKRGQHDLTLALALIHHLAIANNLPLEHIADFFHSQTKNLIIEFVPKEDSNTQRLLSAREDIFPNYTVEGFEKAFSTHFTTKKRLKIKDSSRILYLLESKP